MQRRHRARQNFSQETIAHHEVITFAQFRHKFVQLREIVGVIGIAHQDELTARRGDPALQGAAVAAPLHGDDARAKVPGNLLRSVGAAVVGDDHFAADAMPLQGVDRFFDANARRLPLHSGRA